MGLLSRLKSLLGMEERERRGSDVSVTVERESSGTAERDAADETDAPTAETEAEAASEAETEAEAASEAETEPAGATSGPAAESVESIKGIGPAYGERLAAAGVATVGDLATADAAALADETDIAPGRVEGWQERARARVQ
jgi:predicted flap endonuclease-1-like 5' DNA nuclease